MWKYKNQQISSIEDMPKDTFGFVYLITNIETGEKYIGKKTLVSRVTRPPLKGEKRKRKVLKESNWKNYYSSNKVLKQLIIQGKQHLLQREILEFAPNKKLLSYFENYYLYFYKTIEPNSNFLNDNISGKFFSGDFF